MGAAVSKHWNPDEDLALVREQRAKRAWPKGATAGLAMLGLTCVGLAILLYRVAGPRDVVLP